MGPNDVLAFFGELLPRVLAAYDLAGVAAADVVKAAHGVYRILVESVTVFDVYKGKGIGPGKKSLAVGVRLHPRSRTLTASEFETVSGKIVGAVAKATGATLRT